MAFCEGRSGRFVNRGLAFTPNYKIEAQTKQRAIKRKYRDPPKSVGATFAYPGEHQPHKSTHASADECAVLQGIPASGLQPADLGHREVPLLSAGQYQSEPIRIQAERLT